MKNLILFLSLITVFSGVAHADNECSSSADCPGVSTCDIANGQCVYPDGNSGSPCQSSIECPGTMTCNISVGICQ